MISANTAPPPPSHLFLAEARLAAPGVSVVIPRAQLGIRCKLNVNLSFQFPSLLQASAARWVSLQRRVWG